MLHDRPTLPAHITGSRYFCSSESVVGTEWELGDQEERLRGLKREDVFAWICREVVV